MKKTAFVLTHLAAASLAVEHSKVAQKMALAQAKTEGAPICKLTSSG